MYRYPYCESYNLLLLILLFDHTIPLMFKAAASPGACGRCQRIQRLGEARSFNRRMELGRTTGEANKTFIFL